MILHSLSDKNHSRRDRHIERQRKLIMDASAGLFSQKGYAATTTKDIAEAADIGESTLYGYFPGKRDILLAILGSQVQLFDTLFGDLEPIASRAEMVQLIDRVLEQVLMNKVYTRALFAEAWINDEIMTQYVIERWVKFSRLLSDFLDQEFQAGIMRAMDTLAAARFIIATTVGVMLPYLRSNDPAPGPEARREISEMIISLILHGLAANPTI
jgi:AcrR family transcriptional regulator